MQVLAKVRGRRPDQFTAHEQVIAEDATYLDGRGRCRLSMDRTYDDTWATTGDLDPESGLQR